ncbi:amidohydrolase family protein [Reichenbachiella ulvae]|uniref:Amidohydrolase family protein n=1 Tax=Reichenbachiella ulvae TaxID=2980104 RepID=A0ABT3CRF6_9BACT|nr:amidohydrolase family protein [Reichenbachiella ulvae]MCV9386286.1 amidohydrolase family protein [Reichenbachiella ulvae]
MKKNIFISFLSLLSLSLLIGCGEKASDANSDSAVSSDTKFDLVILNGRVMDPETNFDGLRNVGVLDGKIALITEDSISGKETIDAKGHVVAPGFIDIHSHISDFPFGQKLSLRDGVTTPLDMEAGAYPVNDWYAKLEGKSQTNYGAAVSAAAVREILSNPDYQSNTASILLDAFDPHNESGFNMSLTEFLPSPEQINEMEAMLEEGVEQGALGLGAVPGYMTRGTTSRETIMWQRLMGEHGLSTVLHGRFSSQMPPTTGILGTQEMLASVAAYGGGLYVSHLHQQALNYTPAALDLVKACKNNGLNTVAAIYPYWQGATVAGADYLAPDNYQRNMDRSYEDIIEVATMKPLTKERYDELLKTQPGASVIFGGVKEEIMLQALADSSTMIESDAAPLSITETGELALEWSTPYESAQGHPRGAGSHAKALRLVREKNLMPLMLAISKMSYMQAQFLQDNGVKQMTRKGRLQEGADADITIFDPETVTDNATMAKGGLPSTGIPYVIVNGTVVVRDSKVMEGVYPGQPIRNKTKI